MVENYSDMFFLIGAPKSGTSSLSFWMDAHPSMLSSRPKETFFFMDSTNPLAGRHGASIGRDGIEAFDRFFDRDVGSRLRFEATTHTFYQAVARDYLARMHPTPRVIMLLREPAARLLSSFRFTRDNLANCDRSLTFDQYVECLLAGNTDALDHFYRDRNSLWIAKRELELGRYVEWIDWWLEKLAHERMRLMLFERIEAEPRAEMIALCDWLDVDSSFYADYDFSARNATYAVGRQGLHRLIRRLGPLVPRSGLTQRIKSIYFCWQQRQAVSNCCYEEGLSRIRAHFAPYNRALAERHDLDLQRWWSDEALHADG